MSALFEAKGTASPVRRIAAGVVVLVGVALLISTFANNLFKVGPDFEEMIDDFRPLLAEESIATAQADLAMLDGVSDEFGTQIVPALSQQLGMTAEEFMGFTSTNFPDVANGVEALPGITTTFTGLVDTLDQQRDLFDSADQIPTKDLPATTVPWGLLLAGIAAIAAGIALYKPGWLGLALTGGLGVLIVVVTLILTLVPKATDADSLNENLEPIYTAELVAQANGALGTVGAMGAQMQDEMLPALGQQLGMTGDELNGFLGQNFPATAQALQALPDAMGRFGGLVSTFENNLDNYDTIKPVAFSQIIWTLLIGGLVTLGAFGAAWWWGRDRRTSKDISRIIETAQKREKVHV
ncbi:MAG: hypothetical protein OER12_04020 [Acidimicrobiia bacterium]|nr:hypothetical protein [Acidimicrobiia bacterium]